MRVSTGAVGSRELPTMMCKEWLAAEPLGCLVDCRAVLISLGRNGAGRKPANG